MYVLAIATGAIPPKSIETALLVIGLCFIGGAGLFVVNIAQRRRTTSKSEDLNPLLTDRRSKFKWANLESTKLKMNRYFPLGLLLIGIALLVADGLLELLK